MSNPTISIPRSQKRWQISTIFTPEKMHTAFVPSSIQFTIHLWKFVEGHHTTFVTVFIPPSFYQDFPTAYQSVNSKISQFSQLSQLSKNSRLSQLSQFSQLSQLSQNSRLSQLSQNSRFSTISTISRLSLLSTLSTPSPPSPTTKCSTE